MAFSQEDLEKLAIAITKQEKRVRFQNGMEVEYQSTKEMQEAYSFIEKQIRKKKGNGRKTTYAVHSKGF